MKKIKFILVTIIILINFIVEVEIFQLELSGVECDYLYSDFSAIDEKERMKILSKIEEIAKEKNQGVFLCDYKNRDLNNWDIIIFANEIAKDNIIKEKKIPEGNYNSLMFGNSRVVYKELIEASNIENKYVKTINYTGNRNDAEALYTELKNEIEFTYPVITVGSSNRPVVYFVWIMLASLMLVLTIITVFSSKKEVVLRVSLGENVWKIIFKNMVVDICIYVPLYIVLRIIVFQFLTGTFMFWETFAIYLLGIVCSSFLYLSYALFDVRAAFHNAPRTKGMLYLLYVIKIVMTCITMTGTIFGLNLIENNTNFLSKDNYIPIYESYNYLVIEDLYSRTKECTMSEADFRSGEEKPNILQDVYGQYYDEAEPIVCGNFTVDTCDFTFVNKHGEELIKQFSDITNDEEDVLVFVSKRENYEQVMEIVNEELAYLFDLDDSYSKKTIFYSENKRFTTIHRSDDSGAVISRNPVIIYIQNDELSRKLDIRGFDENTVYNNFSEEQIEAIKTKYKLEERGYSIIAPSFIDNYNYHNSYIKRILGFAASFVVLLFMLLFFLLILINTFEYQINAMDFSLKKVVGYSIIEKNIRYICLCALLDSVIGMAYAIFYYVNHIYTVIGSIVIVSSLIVSVELIICFINIIRIERKSIVKILKGGCL